jgi:uncharacterized protein YkwD
MFRAITLSSLFLALGGGLHAQPAPDDRAAVVHGSQTSSQPTPTLLSAAMASSTEDSSAESELLQLANQRRKEAGVPPLRGSEDLTAAARVHARLMVSSQQLSHQFNGEPSLMPRLRSSGLPINSVGENVVYHSSVEKAFEALMQSPPHRQNLLDPDFNIAGMAALWSGGRLYVVQDFAHVVAGVMPAAKHQR